MFKVNIPLELMPVAYWGYEKAFSTNFISKTDYFQDSDDVAEKIHLQFIKEFGVNPDNKQTFLVMAPYVEGNPKFLYFTFHDGRMCVGTNVRPYRGGNLSEPTWHKDYVSDRLPTLWNRA